MIITPESIASYTAAAIGVHATAVAVVNLTPTPYASWLLDETTCQWVPPMPMPNDGAVYRWDEAAGEWVAA